MATVLEAILKPLRMPFQKEGPSPILLFTDCPYSLTSTVLIEATDNSERCDTLSAI